MRPEDLITLCEELIKKGELDEARKVAKGISILSGYPAWEKAYNFIIDDRHPAEFIKLDYREPPEELPALLNKLHDVQGEEFKYQSLRGGTQVSLTENQTQPLRSYLNRLSNKFIGVWSSRLQNGGYHVNHIHPRGNDSWIWYISVPMDSIGGHLEFGGSANKKSKLSIIPYAGMIVSFPCWLFHAVSIYKGEAPRLTIAYDT